MKDSINPAKEFEELTGNLSDAMYQMSDPVEIARMLYAIAEEKKGSNLVVREINAKFDNILQRLDDISQRLSEMDTNTLVEDTKKHQQISELSDRDHEVLNFVSSKSRVCADDVQKKFKYKGRNAASARLSKLFRDNMLEKLYVGRKVYYITRN